MYGAIIGDIAGSTYEVEEMNARLKEKTIIPYEERIKRLDPNTPLFPKGSVLTDDTHLTVALADCILHEGNYKEYLQSYGKKALKQGKDKRGLNPFGRNFTLWLQDGGKNNDSFGNGSGMRISPVGFYYDTYMDVKRETIEATKPSHNTEEGIKGALAISTSIYWLLKGRTKEEIKEFIEKEYEYNLDFNLEELQRTNAFYATCKKSVPQAIFCFLESTSFEDAIRKALSIGGDTDTIAAMTGSLAEAYYGVPEDLKQQALSFLPEDYVKVVQTFHDSLQQKGQRAYQKRH